MVSARTSCRLVGCKVAASCGHGSRERRNRRPVTHANTETQNHPKRNEPPPPHHPHCRQHYNNRLPFVINTTSLFVCRLVSAVSTRFKAADSYNHVTLSDYLCFQWQEGLHNYHNSDATGVPPRRMSRQRWSIHRATETSN